MCGRIQAMGFDVEHILVRYNNPLNWKGLYEPALRRVLAAYQLPENPARLEAAVRILLKYNTRENPREYEVSSEVIFQEIFEAWGENHRDFSQAKSAFYGFFQAAAVCYEDAAQTLRELCARGIRLGFLTDVAYGMDDAYALQDIAQIAHFFSAGLTSTNVGFRKPNAAGYEHLARALGVAPCEMLFVGDEEKDILGANRAGMVPVLIHRSDTAKNWGQAHTISNLDELLTLI